MISFHRLSKQAALLLGVLFVLMLVVAKAAPGLLHAWDDPVAKTILPLQSIETVAFFYGVTQVGGAVSLVAVAFLVVYMLHCSASLRIRLMLLMTATYLSTALAKLYVGRIRPEEFSWLDPFMGFAFPSGHASLTTALYGFIAVVAYRRARTTLTKVLAAALPLLVILGVSISRIVVNAHYATDVIGGVLLGLFWLCLLAIPSRARLPRR